MSPLSFSERIAYAAVGAVLGAMVGIALFWTFDVFWSDALESVSFANTPAKFVGCVVFGFAAIGLLSGPSVGVALGHTIAEILEDILPGRLRTMLFFAVVYVVIILLYAAWSLVSHAT